MTPKVFGPAFEGSNVHVTQLLGLDPVPLHYLEQPGKEVPRLHPHLCIRQLTQTGQPQQKRFHHGLLHMKAHPIAQRVSLILTFGAKPGNLQKSSSSVARHNNFAAITYRMDDVAPNTK